MRIFSKRYHWISSDEMIHTTYLLSIIRSTEVDFGGVGVSPTIVPEI